MKPNATTIALAFVFVASVFSAHADEKLSSLQTALSSTTISGYESVEMFIPTVNTALAAFQPEQQVSERQAWPAEFSHRLARNDGSSLSPLPLLNPSEVESIAPTLNLIDVSVQNPSLNLRIFQPAVGDVNSIAGETYGGDSAGAVMIETILLQTARASQFSSVSPAPDLQIQFNQGGIQPAPEPSTIALGSLALGLIALTRLNRRQRVLK
ncbi:MAG: PEP-CTERM sorting domain-containing protein [Verrucomicrobiota bacterium]|jgi:hypothetical protein